MDEGCNGSVRTDFYPGAYISILDGWTFDAFRRFQTYSGTFSHAREGRKTEAGLPQHESALTRALGESFSLILPTRPPVHARRGHTHRVIGGTAGCHAGMPLAPSPASTPFHGEDTGRRCLDTQRLSSLEFSPRQTYCFIYALFTTLQQGWVDGMTTTRTSDSLPEPTSMYIII